MSAKLKACIILSCLVFIGLIGIALVTWGFIGPPIVNNALQEGIRSQVLIDSERSAGYQMWLTNANEGAVPMYFKAYMFNLTNPDDFLAGRAKPNFQELGPYSYREYTVHYNVSFSDDGEQMAFKTWKYYVFDEATSARNPYEDVVTTLNIPFQGENISMEFLMNKGVLAQLGEEWYSRLGFDVLCSLSHNCSLIGNYVVNDLIWGYNDPFLEFLSNLLPGLNPRFQLQVNQTSQDQSFNTTTFDVMYTGKSNISLLRSYISYQGNTSLTLWGSAEANTIGGTDGTQFAPFLDRGQIIETFITNLFRIGHLFANTTVDVEGITLWRYNVMVTDGLNATLYPPNAAFYQFGPSGVENQTVASSGAPVFVSKAHFLDADPYYLSLITGLSPNRSLHETNVDVEPNTGVTMNAEKRLQVNVRISDVLLLYPNINVTYFPVAWFEESATISAKLAKEFRDKVYLAIDVKKYSKWVGWGAGGAFVLVSAIIMIVKIVKLRKSVVHKQGYVQINDSGISE